MEVQGLLRSMVDRFQGRAGLQTMYGEPIVADGKTLIPCAKIAFGFGGGAGSKPAEPGEGSTAEQEGGSGGGGFAAKPVGVVEVTAEGTRFIPFTDRKKMAGALLAGLLLGVLWSRWRRR
jgi:uncharacterized spore protein YtfJ